MGLLQVQQSRCLQSRRHVATFAKPNKQQPERAQSRVDPGDNGISSGSAISLPSFDGTKLQETAEQVQETAEQVRPRSSDDQTASGLAYAAPERQLLRGPAVDCWGRLCSAASQASEPKLDNPKPKP